MLTFRTRPFQQQSGSDGLRDEAGRPAQENFSWGAEAPASTAMGGLQFDLSTGPAFGNQVVPDFGSYAGAAGVAELTSVGVATSQTVPDSSSVVGAVNGFTISLDWDSFALAAPQSFRDGMIAAANLLTSAFANAITIHIKIGYGEFNGASLNSQTGALGGWNSGFFISYANLRSSLAASTTSAEDASSVNALPIGASIQGFSNFRMAPAQAKAFGLLTATNTAEDGVVGMGTQITGNNLISVGLHELTHAMGRLAGTSMDLFRFTSQGVRLFGGATPAAASYFSADGGVSKLADFGRTSDPGDLLNTGVQGPNDPFNEFYNASTLTTLTAVDLKNMDVLGYTLASNFVPRRHNDFNFDGRSDIAFQHVDGSVAVWEMNGPSIVAGGAAVLANPGPTWKLVGGGDFFGVGSADLLLQNTNGDIAFWGINQGASAPGLDLAQTSVLSLHPGAAWRVVGAGDFDHDGKSDIALQNTDGSVAVWDMNGATIGAGGAAVLANPGTSWHLKTTGDFFGEGTADLLFQNDSGALAIWGIGQGATAPVIDGAETSVLALNPGAIWQVKGTGDFNGDGKSDILFQNSSSGDLAIWEMNGASLLTPTSAAVLASPGVGWAVKSIGDYNGDGKSDVLLLNSGTGQLNMWFMSDLSILPSSTVLASNPGTSWSPVA